MFDPQLKKEYSKINARVGENGTYDLLALSDCYMFELNLRRFYTVFSMHF